MQNNECSLTSHLKGVRQQLSMRPPLRFSLCLWVKVSVQALLIMAYQVSSDLHSVDASLFTTFDVHENTLDLPVFFLFFFPVLSGVGRDRPDIICGTQIVQM